MKATMEEYLDYRNDVEKEYRDKAYKELITPKRCIGDRKPCSSLKYINLGSDPQPVCKIYGTDCWDCVKQCEEEMP